MAVAVDNVHDLSVPLLKQIKNSVIGNPSAKLHLSRDECLVRALVDSLNASEDDLRKEAIYIISSLSYGSEEALATLLRLDAPNAFLCALSTLDSFKYISLRAAFARALRVLTSSISEVIGPSQWGLKTDKSSIRSEAVESLNYLFRVASLDIYLPLLADISPQTSSSIALLLSSSIRTSEHRKIVTEWLPPAERIKEVKTKRGWEKSLITSLTSPAGQGGWVAHHLTALLQSRNHKLQESALSALASLSRDNPLVAGALSNFSPDRNVHSPYSSVLSLTKSRQIDVQLAACLCATHIIRASSSFLDELGARTVMSIVSRVLAAESPQNRTKACFILYYLITDDPSLCYTAYERGCLKKLATLVQSLTPIESKSNWEEHESESVANLREAALTVIAAISLFHSDIRRSVSDDLHLLPYISTSLAHRHPGNRYAACQCVRALSRAVAVLRTTIVDSGLGLQLFIVFKKEDEDRRVIGAALSAVCNIVNEFSPLRPVFMERGLMARLIQLLQCGDPTFKLNSLWAIKNLLRKTTTETKLDVMRHLTWQHLVDLLSDSDEGVQVQAYNVVRNIAENENGINMIFDNIGGEMVLKIITTALASPNEEIILQAASTLANLTNGTETQQQLIVTQPQLLARLRICIGEARADIKGQAVSCILELVRRDPKRRHMMVEAGIASTLRHLCEWTSVGGPVSGGVGSATPVSPRGPSLGGWVGTGYSHHAVDVEKTVVDNARVALDWLEHADVYHAAGAS